MATEKPLKLTVIRRFATAPERIYDAFLDPAKAGKFMFVTTAGKIIKCEINPTIGGGFEIFDKRAEGVAEHYGKFLDLTRPKRISFNFAVQKDFATYDLVVIDIAAKPGVCEVSLTHNVDPKFADYEDKIKEGWLGILEGLGRTLKI